MGLPELASHASSAQQNGHKGTDVFASASEFDSTLEKLSPHLLARLSLHPGGMAGRAGGGRSPGTPGSSSSCAGSPSETASSGSRQPGSDRHRRRGNRSWAKQAPLPDLVAPPGLTPPSRSSVGSLPSPPYSADVDRAFRQRGNTVNKSFSRPRSAESTPGSTPSRGVPLPPSHESPPSASSQPWETVSPKPLGSHPRPSSSRLNRQHQPRKLLLSDAGQRLLRAGQRGGSEAGSEEGAPSQTRAHPTSNASATSSPIRETNAAAACAAASEYLSPLTAAGKCNGSQSPRSEEIHASAGPDAAGRPPPATAAAAAAPPGEGSRAEESGEDAQRRLERLRTEKELADDLATQMAMQAQQLVAERADMAARNAELARENAQLMARLEFLEASRGAAADGGNTAEDGDAQQPEQQALEEELGFLHDLLQRAEEEKALLEWQLQQQAVSLAHPPDSEGHGLGG